MKSDKNPCFVLCFSCINVRGKKLSVQRQQRQMKTKIFLSYAHGSLYLTKNWVKNKFSYSVSVGKGQTLFFTNTTLKKCCSKKRLSSFFRPSGSLKPEVCFFLIYFYGSVRLCILIHEAYPQSRPVMITISTTCGPSVRPSQNFKIKRQSLPARSVGWPSGSLMTPVFSLYILSLHWP